MPQYGQLIESTLSASVIAESGLQRSDIGPRSALTLGKVREEENPMGTKTFALPATTMTAGWGRHDKSYAGAHGRHCLSISPPEHLGMPASVPLVDHHPDHP